MGHFQRCKNKTVGSYGKQISFLSHEYHFKKLHVCIVFSFRNLHELVGWLVVWGLTALLSNIAVYIGPSTKEREKEEKG